MTAVLAAPGVLNADELTQLLPHRHPFFLLDRVTALEPGVSAEALKNISAADPFLVGHFPGRMLYPGVLLVECVAQLAAVVYGTDGLRQAGIDVTKARGTGPAGPATDGNGGAAERVGYLAEIRQAKFLKPVFPGDQLLVAVRSGPRIGSLISVTGQVSVDNDQVMTARLAVTERPQDENAAALD